jgi:hypothetical protein
VTWLGTLWRTSREIVALPARWWHHLGRRKLKPYRYVHVEEFPDALDANKLYIAGEKWLLLGRRHVVPLPPSLDLRPPTVPFIFRLEAYRIQVDWVHAE